MNLSAYLLQRLKSLGVDHVFGIPGDYVLPFFDTLNASEVEHVATCNELNAGYAADGYARLRGFGAAAVTYGPGSFSLVNAVAGAYAERVPMIVICGGPPRDAYTTQPYLHHMLSGNYAASLKIFAEVTADARLIDDPATAPADIDALLNLAVSERRPVYLEIPVDLQLCDCPSPVASGSTGSDASTSAGIALDIAARMAAADHCVALVGNEVSTEGLEEDVLALIDNTALPVASVFCGKAEFLEHHPRCIGNYLGLGSEPEVRAFVEDADVVLWLGAVPSDFNKGASPTAPDAENSIVVYEGRVAHDGETVTDKSLAGVVRELNAALPADRWSELAAPVQVFAHKRTEPYEPIADHGLTNQRLYHRLTHFIEDGDVVLADGGAMVNFAYAQFPPKARLIMSSYWASIGTGLGFTLGACFATSPEQRVLAVLGDGSFQMSAQELSTLIRYGNNCVVIVINNRGYTLERVIHDGPFNDIAEWQYHRLPEAFGGEPGIEVRSEGDLEAALDRAETHAGPGPLLIEVHLDPWDVPEAFLTIGDKMGK